MRPNSQRAKIAIISLYAIVTTTFVASLSALVNIYTINLYHSGDFLSENQISGIRLYNLISLVLYALTYILSAIFFILWFSRAYRNIQIALPKNKFKYRPWAAAVVWFVPVWNIFGPYVIATNLFDKAEDYLLSEDKITRNRNYDIVKGLWWSLWIASGVLIRVSQHYTAKDYLSIPANASTFVGFLLSITCALLAIQMIKNYSKIEVLLLQIQPERASVSNLTSNDELLDTGI